MTKGRAAPTRKGPASNAIETVSAAVGLLAGQLQKLIVVTKVAVFYTATNLLLSLAILAFLIWEVWVK